MSEIPFEIKDGFVYSIEGDDQVVGIFISNGIVENYPNGDCERLIWYKFHACLFNNRSVIKPIILAGPDIDRHNGVRYPREFMVRYATERERKILFKELRIHGYAWNKKAKKITKKEEVGDASRELNVSAVEAVRKCYSCEEMPNPCVFRRECRFREGTFYAFECNNCPADHFYEGYLQALKDMEQIHPEKEEKKAPTFEIDWVNGIIRGTIDKETMDLVRERFPEWIEK